ncbi:PREDICTED: mitochondrial 2-oxoglutarate/malate carrier protein-like [Dinoponera quadriceps]|uniref:Mitochondrial 2-oxoglutarate/malate carrier protein-like n=1 Tax=Dinoponera quadriceps TaxID=609295 RepID=A0A6P3XYU3_DINQU|nr:PREDICTED: mitochondrial 2-oxoglutarate/malate carrier protein-like [Dinoponera quadriceps]
MAATCVVHPMDVIKNRMQIQKGKVSIVSLIGTVYSQEGITKFYSGLTAGLVRQATYTTVRLGIYNQMQDFWRQKYVGPPNFAILALMAGVAGATGAFVGTPADVALVRMTTDGRLPVEQRRNYKNVFDAFSRIAKEEGVFTLWRGSTATMARAVVVNVSQLATYSQVKYLIATRLNVPETVALHFYASMVSGFLTTFNSMPFDIAKTRIQNMKSIGKPPSAFAVMISIAKTEGLGSLWKGFWPTYCRIGPHTVLTLVINEQLMNFLRTLYEK